MNDNFIIGNLYKLKDHIHSHSKIKIEENEYKDFYIEKNAIVLLLEKNSFLKAGYSVKFDHHKVLYKNMIVYVPQWLV